MTFNRDDFVNVTKRLVILAVAVVVHACGPIPAPVPPTLPRPAVTLHVGVVGAYHGPLDKATLATVCTSPDVTIRSAVQSAAQAQAVIDSLAGCPTAKVLWLIEGLDDALLADLLPVITRADRPNPSRGLELGNELDLAGVSPQAFGAWVTRSYELLVSNGFQGLVVSGGIYTTEPDALAYLTRAGVAAWPSAVVVGLHRYGDPDSGVSGFASRDAETAAIRATVAGHPIAVTEFGYVTRTPAEEAWAKDAVTRDLGWFRTLGATLATLYQITDGPGPGNLDHYGIRTVDGRFKPVAMALGMTLPTPAAPTLAFDLVACRDAFVNNYCDGPSGAVFSVEVAPDQWATFRGDGNGYVWATGIPNVPNSRLRITAPGYADVFVAIAPPTLKATNDKGIHNAWELGPAHVDPSGLPLDQLAAIRGAMWPQTQGACGNLSIGPRPGQPTNIFATVFLSEYPKADADCMLAELHEARGYTHAVAGPLVDSDGYHGVWTPNDWRTKWEAFLDQLQTLWDAHLAPVVFIHPDGWTFEQTRDAFTPLLQQPRAQRLIRIAVGSGWEPAGYEWSSCTWTLYAQWVRQVLPNALSLLHNAVKADGSPYDAPVGTDARCDDNGKPNGEGWARIAPYLHGFLIQFGPFSGTPEAQPALARSFAAQYLASGAGADEHGFRWHFVNGISGWPRGSAWGPSTPLSLYYGEGTAYNRFWHGMTEADGVRWGDYAITIGGADGYLDSGSVPVRMPARP